MAALVICGGAGTLLWLATAAPLYQLDQESTTPRRTLNIIDARRGVGQRFIVGERLPRFLLVRVIPDSAPATLRVTTHLRDAAGVVTETTHSLTDLLTGFPAEGAIQQHEPFRGGERLVIPLPPMPPGSAIVTITATEAGLLLPYEIDSTSYPSGTRLVGGREVPGDLGFVLISELNSTERVSHYLWHRLGIYYLVIIVAAAALCALAVRLISNLRAGRPLVVGIHTALLLLLALIYTLPLYLENQLWGVWDWPEAAAHYSSARYSLAAGQFPLWNPYFCGGNPLWGNPQAYWPSLTFLLTLPFGDIVGTKLAITAHIFLGLLGMSYLARTFGLRGGAALLAAVSYTCGGFLAAKIGAGQMNMLTIVWIPWVLYFFQRSIQQPWYVVPAALVYLFIVMEGMVYMAVAGALAVLILTIAQVVLSVAPARTMRALALFITISATIGAVKLLPTWQFLAGLTGDLGQTEGIPPARLWEVVTTRTATLWYHQPWMRAPWHEYSAYLGFAVPPLAALGLVVAIRRRQKPLLALAAVGVAGLLLAIALSVFNPLEYLPVIHRLRNPGRYLILFLLAAAIFAGFAAQALARCMPRAVRQPLLVLSGLLIFLDLSGSAKPAFREVFSVLPTVLARQSEFQQENHNSGTAYHVVTAGLGAKAYCPANLGIYQSTARIQAQSDGDYRGEVYAAGQSEVSLESFTPNKLLVRVGRVPYNDTLYINQKYTPGWRRGWQEAREDQGRIAFRLRSEDAGRRLTLYFLPTSFVVGAAVSAVACLALLAFWVRYLRAAARRNSSSRGDGG